jgi:ABC-type multidrug transport system permease subunit
MKDVFQFVFPGLMLMWVCFIAGGVFADIFEEYRGHTISRLLAGGVTLGQVLLSKMLRCLVVCWICELLLILFTLVVFGVGWRNPVMLFVILTSFNVFVVGLLSLVYGYARSPETANAITVFVFLIAAVLGGSMVPFNELPAALQAVGRWSMIRMAGQGIESLFQSRPVWEALRPSFLLATAGAVLATVGTVVLRRRFESGRIA